MTKSTKLASSIAVGLFAFGALAANAREAHALGPVSVEVGARAGVATNPADSGPNPLGFGIGARGGVEITSLYVGASVMYYLGSSQTISGIEASDHTLLYGLEGGYSIKLLDDILTIRPQIGVGNSTFSATVGNIDASASHLYLEPGVVGLVSLGGLFVGADANYLLIPGVDQPTGGSKTYSSFTLHGQVGFKF